MNIPFLDLDQILNLPPAFEGPKPRVLEELEFLGLQEIRRAFGEVERAAAEKSPEGIPPGVELACARVAIAPSPENGDVYSVFVTIRRKAPQ